MYRRLSAIIGSICFAAAAVPAASQQILAPASPAARQADVLKTYCISCHNDRLKTGGLVLDPAGVSQPGETAELWEKVVGKLRSGAMPPAGARRPDPTTYQEMIAYLEDQLDRAAAAHPNPGRPVIQRLNRTQYANAIRDLLALKIDAEALLPVDDSSYGFDNIGEVLTLSPALLERYLSAAARISRLAVGDTRIAPSMETYAVSERLMQDQRAGEELPFGSRGGVAIRHNFPLDGEYTVRIRLKRDRVNDIIGLAQSHQLDIRLDGALLKSFTVGGEEGKSDSEFGPQDYRRPANESGEESYQRTADAGLEFRFPAASGPHILGVAFLDRPVAQEGIFRQRLIGEQYAQDDDLPGIGSVIIGGPYDVRGSGETPSRSRIFVCRPAAGASAAEQEACASKILSALARRAFRRPVQARDVQTLLGFYHQGREDGGFEAGIEMTLRRILVSPEFLFRFERDPAGTVPGTIFPVSDLELASRLAFFLWSSIPDEVLLDLAEKGRLREPQVLEQQVRRMLADSRSEALIRNFVGQWLYLRNMEKVVPDPEAFPEFDENLRQAFITETELLLLAMLREDRPVTEILSADFTFINERLARHYALPNVYGSHFRRVSLPEDSPRRGLMGKGSVLTVTSYATRTSPTFRGKWVLENILGSPPPAPPNNVPSLVDRGQDGRILSVREQMEMHRKNPACSGCHAPMDPLGFALENFDAIGRWRTTSGAGNSPVDASGELPDGTRFQGPSELRELLLRRQDEFVHTFTEKLLTYALGRGLQYYDRPAIRKIVRESAPGEYRWSSMVLGVVRSAPFQMRRSPSP